MLPALFILLIILSLPLTLRIDGFFALKSPLCAPLRVTIYVFSLKFAEIWADLIRLIAERPKRKAKKEEAPRAYKGAQALSVQRNQA